MSTRSGLWLGLAALLAGGCATSGATRDPARSTEVSVEVLRGVVDPGKGSLPSPPVHVVVDVTSLLGENERAANAKPDAQMALVQSSAPAMTWLEPGRVTLHAFDTLGKSEKNACGSKGTTFATQALNALHADFESRGEAADARVVLVSDLEGECAQDLCRVGQKLAERGSWLDVVILGEAAIPECLANLRPSETPGVMMKALAPTPPAFRVEVLEPGSTTPGRTLANGVAGGPAVRVPSGLVRVVVDVQPVETIGPLQLPPGGAAKIRVMDFPLSAPDERAWIVELRNAQ